jgi:hypothetical protein
MVGRTSDCKVDTVGPQENEDIHFGEYWMLL